MPTPLTPTVANTRRDPPVPTLDLAEIARLRRFGQFRTYAAGDALSKAGDAGHGMMVILEGEVEVTRRDKGGTSQPVVTHGPGAFLGELAQLSGRPALVDAHARTSVAVLVMRPQDLRALLIAEAELGERIMRALILRRVGLIEVGGGGPVIIGPAGHPDVRRLEGFLARNGHPRLTLDANSDGEAKALLDRFHVPHGEWPIVLCPRGELLRNPTDVEL